MNGWGLISEFCYYFLSGDLGPSSSDLLSPGPHYGPFWLGVSSCWEKESWPRRTFGLPQENFTPLFGSPSLFLESILCFSYLRVAFPWRWDDEEDAERLEVTWRSDVYGQWLPWNIPLAFQITLWVWKDPGLKDLDGSTGMSHLTSSNLSFLVHKISYS